MIILLDYFIIILLLACSIEGILTQKPYIIFVTIPLIVILYINLLTIRKRNKENYSISKDLYSFIYETSKLFYNKKFEELKKFLKNARNTNFYKNHKKDNSNYPTMEYMKEINNIDEFDE